MARVDGGRCAGARGLALLPLLLAACDQVTVPEFRSPIVFPAERTAAASAGPASAGSASAASRPTVATVLVGADAANLRAGPGTRHRVVGGVQPGVRLEVLGERAGWLEIRNGSRSAWIAQSLTRPPSAQPTEPATAARPSAANSTLSDGAAGSSDGVLPDF